MMTMRIKDLQATTLLGVYDWEKEARRQVILNLDIEVDADKASVSDDMKDAVDYAMIEQKIIVHLASASYDLIEKLVADIGQLVLASDKRIASVRVEADKPGALRQARSVSISGFFKRSSN